MKRKKFLIVYPSYSSKRDIETKALALRLTNLGYQVEAFGIPCEGGWWTFQKLDEKYKSRSGDILNSYAQLLNKLDGFDIMIADGGSMLHPDFVDQLQTYNIFICADDPESSEVLSKPVASSFDYCFVANIACLDLYRAWGCRKVSWLHLPVPANIIDRNISEKTIRQPREIDISMCSERVYGVSDRANRLEILKLQFPQVRLYGRGWPDGFISDRELFKLYKNTKIGWNLHNSIGPVNSRLMTLPAFGVMQICDCREKLGEIFKLNEEVVGFNSLAECIDLTNYYLNNEKERQDIAFKGWLRVLNDYTEEKWFNKLINLIEEDFNY